MKKKNDLGISRIMEMGQPSFPYVVGICRLFSADHQIHDSFQPEKEEYFHFQYSYSCRDITCDISVIDSVTRRL